MELSRESVTTLYVPDVPLHLAVEPIVRYYKPNFVGKDHANFVGDDTSNAIESGPIIVSFLLPQTATTSTLTSPTSTAGSITTPSDNLESQWSRVIVRTKKEDVRIIVPYSSSRKEMLKSIARAIPRLQVQKWIEVKDPSFMDAVAKFEEDLLLSKFKIGVLLCLDGQTDENDMLSNSKSNTQHAYY